MIAEQAIRPRGSLTAGFARQVPIVRILPTATSHDREPMLEGIALSVLAIVKCAYEQGMPSAEALADATGAPIGRQAVELAVNYCADRACDRDGSHCQGCRLRTEQAGLASLDDFCRQLARVEFADGALAISGPGQGSARFASLETLAKTWAGEEMYYLARRVHRRLHKERDPRPKQLAGHSGEIGPAVILVTPQMADNIGMVARAMANFGLDELRLVAPRDGWPNEKARAAASGANYVIDAATAHGDLRAGIADLHWICATTARQRHMNKPVMTPAQAAAEMQQRIAQGQRVGVLFGPERQGLENDDISLADAVVMAHVNPRFASLNLAQAVLLVGYEWMKLGDKGTLGRVTTYEAPIAPGLRMGGSAPATKSELFGLFEHLERALDDSGFLKPPEKRASMVRNIRAMLERMEATEQEVRTLRGIVASLTYTHKRSEREP